MCLQQYMQYYMKRWVSVGGSVKYIYVIIDKTYT